MQSKRSQVADKDGSRATLGLPYRDRLANLGFESRQGSETHLAPIKWVPGALSQGVQRLRRKVDQSHLPNRRSKE